MVEVDLGGEEFGPDDVLDLVEPALETPLLIGNDERRMHVRAYNYWVSLLKDRPYPSVAELDPAAVDDFSRHSVLLDFTEDREMPRIAYVGEELKEECDYDRRMATIADVPPRSLLSRLTDHFFQIIANRAPIGFEAEFVSQRGNNTLYRGILMPLSSNGETIDFIYGVINWKELADPETAAELVLEMRQSVPAPERPQTLSPIWADGPGADDLSFASDADEDGPTQSPSLPDDADLYDRLAAARDSAEQVRGADARSRAALYSALGQAHDFRLAAAADPDAYAEILADAGIVVQPRAPMTPVVKLIFGVDHDKTRLTEYAAVLSHAARVATPSGGLPALIERTTGGIKALVSAERAHRKATAAPAKTPGKVERARRQLRAAPAVAHLAPDVAIAVPDGEFVLLVARRDGDQGLAVIDAVDVRQTLVDQAVQALAACRSRTHGS